ncbi:MAG: hypothetical protein KJ880_02910 [Candidatus Omnitrophica bacterium]|nr:hypothetical protein [Candidatus Omnitrophota bacterium]
MKNNGKSFIAIMIVLGVLAFVLRFGVDKLIKFTMGQNEANASVTLKSVAAALENYAKDNHGKYPSDLFELTKTNPTYLDRDYIHVAPFKGYVYSCPKLEPAGYICQAEPLKCDLTGRISYSVATGNLFASEECGDNVQN